MRLGAVSDSSAPMSATVRPAASRKIHRRHVIERNVTKNSSVSMWTPSSSRADWTLTHEFVIMRHTQGPPTGCDSPSSVASGRNRENSVAPRVARNHQT